MSHVIIALSDEHSGSKFGMFSPDSDLIDGPYQPTASQVYLWELKQNAIKFIKRFAGNDPITVIHCGDPCQGMKFPTELVSTAPVDQIRIATANWRPLLNLPNVIRVKCATSTEAHSMGESSADHLITDVLKNEYPGIDFRVHHHGLLNIDGYTIDWAHCGPGQSQRAWLEGNIARAYLVDILIKSKFSDTQPPNMVLRGHVHTYVDEVVRRSRIVVLPPLCMPGRYAIQYTKSITSVTVGMMVFRIDGGRLVDERQLFQTIDLREKENVN